MTVSTRPQIDWASAEVREGTLTVSLVGDAPKRWHKRFATVVALLATGGGRWGKISERKGMITVADVSEGSEEELRHLLESAVLQVDSEQGDEDFERADAHDPQEEAQARSDRDMTAAFRGFAQR